MGWWPVTRKHLRCPERSVLSSIFVYLDSRVLLVGVSCCVRCCQALDLVDRRRAENDGIPGVTRKSFRCVSVAWSGVVTHPVYGWMVPTMSHATIHHDDDEP